MTDIRTDLGDLAMDFRDKMLARAKIAAADEAAILKWGAAHCEEAARQWADDKISQPIFQDWIRTITLVRVPSQTGALAKYEAKQATAQFVIGIFQALSILAGAI